MSQSRQAKSTPAGGSPFQNSVLWGGVASGLFFGAVHAGYITNPYVLRYMAGHAIEHVLITLFAIGLAAVILKRLNVASQLGSLGREWLPPTPAGGQPVADNEALLAQLEQTPAALRGGYLYNRLHNALEFVRRKNSAATLDDEIKYLADLDALRAQHRNAFLLIIIWAIPILGLLGTVVGMTLSIANLAPDDFNKSVHLVTDGLGSAFDHTALSLVLTMILMFSKFAADRAEQRLLDEVDAHTAAALVGRFSADPLVAGGEPHLLPFRQMAEAVLQSSDQLVSRQVDLWQSTIEVAHQHWSQLSTATGTQMQDALGHALERGLQAHAAQLGAAEAAAAEQNRRIWSGVEQALVQTSEAIAAQQAELRKQGEVLLQVVEATGQLTALENTLNRNLSTLANSKNFEDTIISLSAAIQLLSTRLGTSETRHVELAHGKRAGHAA